MIKSFAVVCIAVLIIICVSGTRSYVRYREGEAIKYIKSERDSLMKIVRQREGEVAYLERLISLHTDTMLMIERQVPIITNRYYYNERIINNLDDSAQHDLAKRNVLKFRGEYLSGKYSPRYN